MPKTAWDTLMFAVRESKWRIFTMYMLIVIANIAVFSIPYFLKLIADYAQETQNGIFEISAVVPYVVAIFVLLLFHELGFRIAHILELKVFVDSFKRINAHLYQKIIERPSFYFEDKFSGSLGRRIEQIGESVRYFTEEFPWPLGWVVLSMLTSGVLLWITSPILFVGFISWLLLFCVTSYPLLKIQFVRSQEVAVPEAVLSGRVIDTLSNIHLVHSFAANKKEYKYFDYDLGEVIHQNTREYWIHILNKFQQGLSITLLATCLISLSVYLFSRSSITLGDFVLVATIIPTLNSVIWNVGDILIQTIKKYGTLTDAVADLQTEQERLVEGSQDLVVRGGQIEFKNISFTYPGTTENVFKKFSLKVAAGEKLGIVGSSGAGKSTLIKLLLRHSDLGSGSIEIDGVDIREVTLDSLRNSIAFVPQDTTLFHRSLLENIGYAKPDATFDEVVAVSKTAHTHEFISLLPEGYETTVGERGVKLSGGQRQRIAVARAMLKDAPILVLDEATSALDSESEEIVQKGLRELFVDRTVIAIAHRLSTLREMNRIVVIEEGVVVEDGNPQELLMKENSIFRQLWEHQKGGFVT